MLIFSNSNLKCTKLENKYSILEVSPYLYSIHTYIHTYIIKKFGFYKHSHGFMVWEFSPNLFQ